MDGPYTLLDLAQRNDENVHALVEDVVTYAPEWGLIPAITRAGTSYDVMRSVALPVGGIFRDVGDGVGSGKSEYTRETKPMHVFEAQMSIGEDVLKARTAGSKAKTGDILTSEATRSMRASAITMGRQMFYGKKAGPKGFIGLSQQFAGEATAGGADGVDTSSAYLVWLHADPNNPEGAHFVVGNDGDMTFADWQRQQVDKGGGKKAVDYWTNFLSYIGFCVADKFSVFRVRNIKDGNPLTDDLAAGVMNGIPTGRPLGEYRWFMNKTARLTLQRSRGLLTLNQGTGVNYAPTPTELGGVPIVITDSLVSTERAGDLP